ncbi:hypothetical protein [Arcticibacter sp.]|jgi:hypothetical protein|uniref:hypothetical protein n=1 Tax=Arcticibacter sp. TaxID=1872630 RepID=UPI00388EE1E8
MNYRLLLTSAIFSMMMSCSKDNSPQQEILTPGSFADVNTLNILPAELYTQKGKIANQQEVMHFVNKKGLSNTFFIYGLTTLYQDTDLTLVINDDNTAVIQGNIPQNSFRAVISDYKNGQFIITGTDSITSMIGNPGFPSGYVRDPYSMSTCGTDLHIGLLSTSKTCVPVQVFHDTYTQRCSYTPIAAVEVQDANMVFIPTLSYYFTQGIAGERCTFGLYNSWNTLNPEFYKQLSAGDTVLVQRKQIILKKTT